jgi:copper resistance protein C
VRKSAAFGLALVGAAVSIVLSTVPAAAHAVLIDSDPADGAALDDPPTVIELEFNEPIRRDFSQVAVLDADGNHYDVGDAEIVGSTMTQPVQGIGGGEYRISYRVGSADGHPVSDVLTFTVNSDVEPVPQRPPSGEEGTGSDQGVWVAIVTGGVIALLASAAVVYFARRRNLRRTTPNDRPQN